MIELYLEINWSLVHQLELQALKCTCLLVRCKFLLSYIEGW